MKLEYDLTFNEALDLLFRDECWVQGEQFKDGIILLLYGDEIKVQDFNIETYSPSRMWTPSLSVTLVSQKYRRVSTQPDALRKCQGEIL